MPAIFIFISKIYICWNDQEEINKNNLKSSHNYFRNMTFIHPIFQLIFVEHLLYTSTMIDSGDQRSKDCFPWPHGLVVLEISCKHQTLVVHAYNLSYSGGRDQLDSDLKSARANSSKDPISKSPTQKKRLVEWLKVKALSSSPSTARKNKEIL
jgi:hypothetical protein